MTPVSDYVTDTHPLVWYAAGKHRKLSRKALRVFNAAARDEALIYVPAFAGVRKTLPAFFFKAGVGVRETGR